MLKSLRTRVIESRPVFASQSATIPAIPWATKSTMYGRQETAPSPEDGELSSLIPGYFGGNMNMPLFGPSTRVYFPVSVEGAGFSIGDGHALRGDGVAAGTTVETALTGAFRIHVKDNCGVKSPFMVTPGKMVATAVAEDFTAQCRWPLRMR